MGTRHQGPPHEIRALDAFLKLRRAAESVTTRVLGCLPPTLTSTQFGVLEALHHLGPLNQGDLADKLQKSSGNLTMVLANLSRAALIIRERDAADHRFIQVRLSPAGERLITEVFPQFVARVSAEMGRLTPEEAAELGRLCRKLGRAETT